MRKHFRFITGGELLAVLAFVAVLTVALVGGQSMFSPGLLNMKSTGISLGDVASHAELDRNCKACHAPFWTSERMAQRCLKCHSDVAEQLGTGGLHSLWLASGKSVTCLAGCHTEHKGRQAALTTISSRLVTNHSSTAFPLTGKHATLMCSRCHTNGSFEGVAADCRRCHP